MKRSTLLSLIVLLSMLGIADAAYLAETALTNGTLLCNIDIIDGCNTVAKSPYAHLMGVPLGVYGVVFFALFFVLGFLAKKPKPLYDKAILILGVLGLCASAAFLYIQFFLIKALCIYCLVSAAFCVLLFFAAVALYRGSPKGPISASETLPSA
jgi:uncharacterized membrane protein